MDATALDTITIAFVDALQSGTGALAAFSLPLLAVFALIAFYLQLGALVTSASVSPGDAVASVLLTTVKTGVFYWLLVHLAPMATAAFQTFLQWGLAPTEGSISAASYTNPSQVVHLGFRAAAPLRQFITSLAGWLQPWNFFILSIYTVSFWVVILAFAFVALHLMMTMIEYHMAVLVGTVLIPWGVLQPTAFFTEFSIGWLTGGLVRILVTTAVLGIALPLFDLVTVRTTGGGDPTFYSAVVVALTSGVFAVLSWVIPGRAAAIAGRGMSLALHGGALVAGAAGGVRGAILLSAAIRGTSSLLRRLGQ